VKPALQVQLFVRALLLTDVWLWRTWALGI